MTNRTAVQPPTKTLPEQTVEDLLDLAVHATARDLLTGPPLGSFTRVIAWLWSDGQVDRLAELLVSTVHASRTLNPTDPTRPDLEDLLAKLTPELSPLMDEKDLALLTREMRSRVTTRFPGVAG